jgi:hypothetical protein
MGGAFPKWETAILGIGFGLKPGSQNPDLFCTNRRKSSAPREFQWCLKRTPVPRGTIGIRPTSPLIRALPHSLSARDRIRTLKRPEAASERMDITS